MQLTDEQLEIIHHDPNLHATVLAVAGSGKTTTMIHRIKYLVEQKGVPRWGIRVVMYNVAAREDFEKKLQEIGLPDIKVRTFHAMGYTILKWAATNGHIPHRQLLVTDREVAAVIEEAIRVLRKSGRIGRREVIDMEATQLAIATWKSMLTPPEEASHQESPIFAEIYKVFEQVRRAKSVLTFDDQIYDAVRLLQQNQTVRAKMENCLEHLIIDEFQDVNYARLKLAKIIAGHTARVMVVGDDDQCIYEWQGARSSFIKRGFMSEFTDFPHATYTLSRSFRLGPKIAQVAANVIGHNTDRVEKDLIANDLRKKSTIVWDSVSEVPSGLQAIQYIEELLTRGIPPRDIVVLVRKYSQASQLQSLMLARKYPYFVDGQIPLQHSFAVKLAIHYLDLAVALDTPLTARLKESLTVVANRPMRFVKMELFRNFLEANLAKGATVSQVLTDRLNLKNIGLHASAIRNLSHLETLLRKARRPGLVHSALKLLRFLSKNDDSASRAVVYLLEKIDFKSVFLDYEGESAAEENLSLIESFAVLLKEAAVPLDGVHAYLQTTDPKQGKPESDCIRITSIFKAKGLEWEYVFMPDLVERQCPDLRLTVNVCLNKTDPDRSIDPTEALESERRLFYVGVTRAIKGLYLFADPTEERPVSRFISEARIPETVDAVEALQDILETGTENSSTINRLQACAKTDNRLKHGLMVMLRLASIQENLPRQVKSNLNRVTIAVNRTKPAAFTYPEAYPDSPGQKQEATERSGLPF